MNAQERQTLVVVMGRVVNGVAAWSFLHTLAWVW